MTILRPDLRSLATDWSFRPSGFSLRTRLLRARARRLGTRAPPAHVVLKPPYPASRWNCLFLFAPTGSLSDDQRLILAHCRRQSGELLVVVATERAPASVPPELDQADAVIWKALPGFDFSAYAIALHAIAERSPGATAYVQNDSILGPFSNLDPFLDRAAWDLTGFIASRAVENHITSSAFILRDVTPRRLHALRSVLPTDRCYDTHADVVAMQETRLARVAARAMSVGAFWYAPHAADEPSLASSLRRKLVRGASPPPTVDLRGDPALGAPLALLDAGYPFLKRSLFGKFRDMAEPSDLEHRLSLLGWTRAAAPASIGDASGQADRS